MTTISANIVADSIYPGFPRITTMQLVYPRWIHAEFMTHRVFSRNASSSRAVPVERMIRDIKNDPAIPLFWGKNQKGMQAGEECTEFPNNWTEQSAPLSRENAWLTAMNQAIRAAQAFHEAGYHKQIVNRLLEPFAHIRVLVTATEWSNFYKLRIHKDAEPHINLLAQRMYSAQEASTPTILIDNEWHLPYINLEERRMYRLGKLVRMSVARCARVSYMTHDGLTTPKISEDIELYDRLVGSEPIHASPAEHQATPDNDPTTWGNFSGWRQYRKMLEHD